MTPDSPYTFVVIPAFNEEPAIGDVIDELVTTFPLMQVVVVDDGSTDGTYDAAAARPVHVLQHMVNLGAGAAMKTGIDYALSLGAEILISCDADGQMNVEDIPNLVDAVARGDCDVALGTRFRGVMPEGMTRARHILIKAATLFTKLTAGLDVSDTHNGFRAMSRKAAETISLTQNRYAHCSEILDEIARHKLRWVEVPIKIRYTEYSKRKGQSTMGAFDILIDLLLPGRKK